MTQIKQTLTKSNVLTSLKSRGFDELDILKTFCFEFKKLNQWFSIRNEGKPSCTATFKNNKLIISDFGNSDLIGTNVFSFLQYYLNISFYELLEEICRTFNLSDISYSQINKSSSNARKTVSIVKSNEIREEKKETNILIESRQPFSWDIDIELFIKKFKLNSIEREELEDLFFLYNIKFCKYFIINNSIYQPTNKNPSYAFKLKDKYKIYSPLNKEYKWFSNITLDMILGYEQLPKTGDLLIIEKSLKDTVYMKLLGFNSLPLNGEAMMMGMDFYNDLKKRFKRIIYHPDNDVSGIKAGEKFKEKYGLDYFTNPINEPKDTTDYWAKYNKIKTKEMLNRELNIIL